MSRLLMLLPSVPPLRDVTRTPPTTVLAVATTFGSPFPLLLPLMAVTNAFTTVASVSALTTVYL